MEQFELKNKYFEYRLINDNGELKHVSFLPAGYKTKISPEDVFRRTCPYPPEVVIVCDSESYMQPHGKRAYYGGMSHRSRFIRRETVSHGADTDNVFILSDPVTGAETRLHYIMNDESPALRRYTEIINKGTENVTLNHVSSFFLCNFPYFTNDVLKMKLHHFSSCWLYEGTHHIDPLPVLDIYADSRNAFAVESNGTWVCKDHIPFFILEQEEEKLFTAVQIETSQSWRFEIGNGEPHPSGAWLYMQGGIGNETHTGWSLTLKPGDSFVSPVASIAVCCGECDRILNLMHLYREKVLVHHNRNDSSMPIIYNDWLNLMGANNEDEILRQLDVLGKSGVEIYVTDDGWHVPANGCLWDYLGHWEPDPERFPHGMKYLTDEIKRHGMKAGIWCEIEGIGVRAEHYNDESMLLMRNGRFVTDAQHRFLNFTKKKVRDYADRIFDRFAEWGFEYVKIDYNSDSVPGSYNCV
ncbi:MAG: alpha-galactosidase, partial [Clostridia bacterium]|nr:alpha-galactosidase [Clostridia bacterium]